VTTVRPTQASLSIYPPNAESGASRTLLGTLATAGVQVSEAGGGPALVIYDGRLKPEHASLLRGRESSYLLACPGPEQTPRPGDVEILELLLRGGSLTPDFEGVQRYYVGTLAGLRTASERLAGHLEAEGIARGPAEVCADVMYELAANALLDAPATTAGDPKYAHRRDDPALRISPEDAAVIAFGVKGSRAYLGAVDRFGRLSPEPLVRTLEGLGEKAKVNSAGGGAGLGLRRIVEQSDLVAVRVVPERTTEVLCAVDLGEVRRRASGSKSLFFSVERG